MYRLLVGDVLSRLGDLESDSVNCVVTSPPYWGLRDYGVDGQIGLERTPKEFIEKMVAVFREVRRVLRKDGTCWVNLGDSYSERGNSGGNNGITNIQASSIREKGYRKCPGLKRKELVGIPWRVAFALQDDGWYLRQDIIWSKPNPMPESVRDRCTKAHEYIFLLTKGERYFYDQAAIAEPVTESTIARLAQCGLADQEGSPVPGKTNGNMKAVPPRFGGTKYGDATDPEHRTKSGNYYRPSAPSRGDRPEYPSRNRRSVWTVSTTPYPEAHFATFPPDIPRTCILAGCPEGGVVLDPFAGSGTTLQVAVELGREAIGKLIRKRMSGVTPSLFGGPTHPDSATDDRHVIRPLELAE